MTAAKEPRVCLVTGATSGIGRATAIRMAQEGFTVVATGRDPQRLASLTRELAGVGGPGQSDGVAADLSAQDDVRKLAEHVTSRYDRLDVLINNAGMIRTGRRLSPDGYELTWAVNYLAPFLLTNLLLPSLEAGAPSRVVNVTSAVQRFARLDWDDTQFEHRKYSSLSAYSQSKLALVMFTAELAERVKDSGITVNSIHPGGAPTNLNRNVDEPLAKAMGPLMTVTGKLTGASADKAAAPVVHLATAAGLANATGGYFLNHVPARPGRTSPLARDPEARRRLWALSCQMTSHAT